MIYTVTQSGRRVDLLAPDPATITIFDIARHLAKINRFTGATQLPYSVAQHSCLVASILLPLGSPALALWGLLHDAHEAYFTDISLPSRRALGIDQGPLMAMDDAIAIALDVEFPSGPGLEIVKRADDTAFALEWRDLMSGPPPEGTIPCPSGYHIIRPDTWIKAEENFLKMFDRLCIAAGCGRAGVPS